MIVLDKYIPESVLAIYAHPDDCEVACGGTLSHWGENGSQIAVAVLTSGDKGTSSPDVETNDLIETRRNEMESSAEILGIKKRVLFDHPDGSLRLDVAGLEESIVKLIRQERPDTVVCPDPSALFYGQRYINHRDHRVTGELVVDACSYGASSPKYFPDAGVSHTVKNLFLSASLEPDVGVDISNTLAKKVQALKSHTSQVGNSLEWLEDSVRIRAEEAGKEVGVLYAELFRKFYLA